jgi:hypothetical protein
MAVPEVLRTLLLLQQGGAGFDRHPPALFALVALAAQRHSVKVGVPLPEKSY